MDLDLETLKHIKLMFEIHSDHSARCNGYDSLCRTIEEEEKKAKDSEYSDIIFSLTPEQMKKFKEWQEEKGEVYVGAVGGAYTFCFTPTGIGVIECIKCADGTQLDLTEYNNW